MPRSSTYPIIESVNFYATEANPSTNVGAISQTDDGRVFRYVKAGAVALVSGNLLQTSAQDTNFKDMAVQAAVAITATPSANGGYAIPVTLGGTATTSASQFAGGILVISASSGIGQVFSILANDVQATTTGTCNFYVLEAPTVALTTSSKATVLKNPFDSVIVMPTAHTGAAIGGAVSAIPISNFGWVQVGGLGAALSDATVTAAATMGLSASVTTAGTVTKAVAADTVVAASMLTVTVSAEVQPCFWLLA